MFVHVMSRKYLHRFSFFAGSQIWIETRLDFQVFQIFSHLELLCPVVDGVSVPGVHGGGARGSRTATLLLQEGSPIGVHLAAHREGGADGQVCVLFLGGRIMRLRSCGGEGAWGAVVGGGMRFIGRGLNHPPEVGSLGDTAVPPC